VRRKKIIYIDDDKDIFNIVAIILAEENIQVIESSQSAIINEISLIKPDLVLLDEWLGDKKGSSICQEIKSIEEHTSIPIILISAVNDLKTIAKECAADAYIEKPFDIEKLVSVIKSFLR
jgi:DNA-binding response OmpR family regulator